MAIKKHDSSKRTQTVNSIQNNLQKCLNVQEVPEIIRQKILALQTDIASLNFDSLNEEPLELTGHVATLEEVLSLIQEQSECTKWKNQETTWDSNERKDQIEWIKKEYNVIFDESNVQYYFISRDTRNEISVIEVITLPGYFQVSYQSSSVGWNEKNLLNLKEFKSAIGSTVD